MAREVQGGATSQDAGFRADSAPIPETGMANAATYEQLLACWTAIKSRLDSSFGEDAKKHGTLGFWLNTIQSCFSRPPYECDTGVKSIFESEDLRGQLRETGIPEEFLLHTVRMGAVKGMMDRLEKNPARPARIYHDGTRSRLVGKEIEDGRLDDAETERERLIGIIDKVLDSPNIDGYSWADGQLAILVDEKKAMEESKRQKEAQKIEADKQDAIARIQKNMREPDFHLAAADAKLLKPDFTQKLRLWKALLESGVRRALYPFLEAQGDKEITTEIFEQLEKVCETDPAVKRTLHGDSLPLEIVNPDSGWFSVLLINKKTTLNNFFSAAYGNMDSWFEL